jgi:hypothetical protein
VIKSLKSGLKMDIAAIEVAENSMDRLDSARPGKLRSSSLVTGKSRKMRTPLISFRAEESNGGDSSSRKGSEFIEQSLRSTHSSRTAIAKQRLIRMLIVIVIIFFCCWTPSYIWWLLLNAQDHFGTFNVWHSELNTFITVLTYLSSCTNPITYCFLNSKFRTALFLSFGCKRNALRTRFQKVYAPGNTTTYPHSNNASFREPESTSNNETHPQPKEIKRSMSLTFNVLTRLRSVISKKESPKEPKRLELPNDRRRSHSPRNLSISTILNNTAYTENNATTLTPDSQPNGNDISNGINDNNSLRVNPNDPSPPRQESHC